jgi:putative addiction module component (TIGR02574 family)
MLLLNQFLERSSPMRVKDIPEIERLSTAEKILLVEDIWDSISSEEAAVPVPQSHMAELDRRLEKYKSGPGELLSLDDLKKRIESRK